MITAVTMGWALVGRRKPWVWEIARVSVDVRKEGGKYDWRVRRRLDDFFSGRSTAAVEERGMYSISCSSLLPGVFYKTSVVREQFGFVFAFVCAVIIILTHGMKGKYNSC